MLLNIIFKANIDTTELCAIYCKYVRFLLTVPGSSCTNERSFSTIKRLKTYMRATMSQERPNDMTILTTYKERAAQLDLEVLIDEFIVKNSLRKSFRWPTNYVYV